MATEQEMHVFCAWCWRAVPAHGNTYVPRPHPDTLGKPCRGEAMCGATTYSVGTPPCARVDDDAHMPVIALPSSVDCAVALAERSAEADALRAEVERWRHLLARAARCDLPRCYSCLYLATQETDRSNARHRCDACIAEEAAVWPEVAGWYRDLPHAAALRAAMEMAK